MTMSYSSRIEDILQQLANDIITPKFASIKHTANVALEILVDADKLKNIEAWELREICLEPLQLALESRARKLGHTALAGIQSMFKDERFRSSMETSDEEKWLPSQVLTVLAGAHSLAEDLQIEVMKLLLNMTITASWCTSAKTIIKIAQAHCMVLTSILKRLTMLSLHTNKNSKEKVRACLLATLAIVTHGDGQIDSEIENWLAQVFDCDNVYMGSYQNCVMVQGAVQAAFITMINKFISALVEMEESVVDIGDDVLADFKSNCRSVFKENLVTEVVLLLIYLTDRLEAVSSTPQSKQTLPLLLEGVNIILNKVPHSVTANVVFQELLWKRLTPCLIDMLGEPKIEKIIGQNTGKFELVKVAAVCSVSPNITQVTSKIICSVAGELASLVGRIPQLRPVLETLFHKILMFPLPQSRYDALRVFKELMSDPEKIVSLVGGTHDPPMDNSSDSKMALIKMLIGSIHQSSHSSDPSFVYSSIICIDSLLESLDKIKQGEAISDILIKQQKGIRGHMKRSMTSNPDDDGGSNITCEQYEIEASFLEETSVITETTCIDRSLEISQFSPKKSPLSSSRAQFEAEEQENAKNFVAYLRQMMPSLKNAQNIHEIDETLQDIAAQFCLNTLNSSTGSQLGSAVTPSVVLNSDGVYVAAIVAIKFNLKLIHSGYYQNRKLISYTEADFTNEIFNSSLLLYLPPAWLKEVYSQILIASLLEVDDVTSANRTIPLINMIQDLDGLGTSEERGRLMSDFRKEPEVTNCDSAVRLKKAEVGKLIAAGIMSNCWMEILDILSVMLNEQLPITGGGSMTRYSLSLLLATDSAQEDVRKARSAICTSLNGLQRAAKLCCVLGLQQLCGSAFSQLARTSCVKEDFRAMAIAENKTQNKPSLLSSNKPKLVKLHAAHVLSMDVVMTTGLEMGSHSADCWRHVFRCCAHISELEYTYFSQGNYQSSLPKLTQGSAGQKKEGTEADGNCYSDLYSSQVSAVIPVAPRINVPVLIQQSGLESGWDNSLAAGGVLTFAQASKALCGLSQEVDSLFEEAADKLCLEALLQFLTELGEAMLGQLQRLAVSGDRLFGGHPPTNALHLYRLQQVLVRLVNGSRPLFHLLRIWSVVSPYLVQATSSVDHVISKMAVTSIHEFIVSLVSQREEKAHFHVNEFVCKTFEDMLCMEVCDGDVQDQIVCCICELVEACSRQLQSGWRPLFGALRSVKIEYTTSESVNEARQRHVAAVMDVFDIYLNMDNVSVFANATVDCVLCLLKYVHGPAKFDGDSSDDRSESGSEDEYGAVEAELENLCIPALKYLTKVCQILAFMWKMPACPVFKGAHRIQADSASRFVDPEIPSLDFKLFAEEFQLNKIRIAESEIIPEEKSFLTDSKAASDTNKKKKYSGNIQSENQSCIDGQDADADRPSESIRVDSLSKIELLVEKEYVSVIEHSSHVATRPNQLSGLNVSNDFFNMSETNVSHVDKATCVLSPSQMASFRSLEEMDNKSGILHVWFLLLDGLVTSVNRCPKAGQSHALNTLIDLLKSASKVPGPEFSLHCINHLLLPMLQSWLRRGARCYGYWNTAIVSFKQCCGLVADLTVEYLKDFAGEKSVDHPLQLMLKQIFYVFKECVAQPVENISRLGCSCIRHIILSAGPLMTEPLWQICAVALRQTLGVTTHNLKLLMALFHPNSDNFYGDIGQVKVATRKDCTVVDCLRLRQMAKQVFLLDSQISSMPNVLYDTDQDKSFVFLLYPPNHKDSLNPDHISTRVPFRQVVIGLLSNQLLLQTVGSVLLERSADHKSLPGLIDYMSTRNVHQILSGLQDVYKVARDFDARPGLKFLLQKVACLDVAANLYKQAVSAILFHTHTLIEICAHLEDASISATKAAITPMDDTPGSLPSVFELQHTASSSLTRPCQNGKLFLPLLQIVCEELCQTYIEVLQDAGKGSILDTISEKPIFFLTAQHDNISLIAAHTHVAAVYETKPPEHIESHKSRSFEREPISETEGIGSIALNILQSQSDSEAGSDPDDEETKQSTATSVTSREEEEDVGRTKSKREIREELESKVYTVATDQVIENLMSQYKRHKHQRAMPNYVRLPKFQKRKVKTQRKEPVDEALDKQQKSSIMKDSEAQVQAWSDTLTALLQMTLSLSDDCFSSLLPVIFTFVSNLILHASDPALRDQLAQCFIRLGKMYDFAPKTTGTQVTKNC